MRQHARAWITRVIPRPPRPGFRRLLVAATAVGASAAMAVPGVAAASAGPHHGGRGLPHPQAAGQWPVAGQNTSNDRYQPNETIIGPRNVSKLTKK